MRPKKKAVFTATTLYAPGEQARTGQFNPGDFILTHGNNLFDGCIRWAQGLRFHGENRKFTWWSHAALIVSKNGDLIEAVPNRVCRSHISKYKDVEYQLVRLSPSLAGLRDRLQAVDFAKSRLRDGYGMVTILSILVGLVSGCRFSFGFENQEICSELVSRSLERTGAIFPHEPSRMMPADLAKFFNVSIGEEKNRTILPPREPFFAGSGG